MRQRPHPPGKLRKISSAYASSLSHNQPLLLSSPQLLLIGTLSRTPCLMLPWLAVTLLEHIIIGVPVIVFMGIVALYLSAQLHVSNLMGAFFNSHRSWVRKFLASIFFFAAPPVRCRPDGLRGAAVPPVALQLVHRPLLLLHVLPPAGLLLRRRRGRHLRGVQPAAAQRRAAAVRPLRRPRPGPAARAPQRVGLPAVLPAAPPDPGAAVGAAQRVALPAAQQRLNSYPPLDHVGNAITPPTPR